MDLLSFMLGKAAGGGGGGSSVTVESLTVATNDTYTAPAGKAYSPVTVNVPNSYSAGDEGKVVSNGALVAQSSDTVTENDTYDTTLINSLTVNVSGGGGSDVVTGTITFDNAQNVSAAVAGEKVSITHNLGRVPIGFAWFPIDTDAANLSGTQFSGDHISGGEYITDTAYIAIRNISSSGSNFKVLFYGTDASHDTFASLTSDSTTMLIFTASSYRNGTIPAGTTIRWFVW